MAQTETKAKGARPEWRLEDRLRRSREYRGFDQRTLAEEMGVSRATVSNYERGLVRPRLIVLKAWAAETGVDPDWLCPRPDSNWQPTDCLWVRALNSPSRLLASATRRRSTRATVGYDVARHCSRVS